VHRVPLPALVLTGAQETFSHPAALSSVSRALKSRLEMENKEMTQ
jgi:hypothetical protein